MIILLNYLLLAALLAVGVYMFWDERKNWVLVYETTGHAMHEAQAKFAYLKSQGIKCRMKTSSARGIIFRGVASPSMLASVKVEVQKKDLEMASKLLDGPGVLREP